MWLEPAAGGGHQWLIDGIQPRWSTGTITPDATG
jgi:hypothetical protein